MIEAPTASDATNVERYFLPYQRAWLEDDSRVKLWEKSRRIGATHTQAYEDVRDAISGKAESVWFSSADESAAREYIRDCAKFATVFDALARGYGASAIDERRGAQTMRIEFRNGARITALASNPTSFRSKGGKVVLDEFAFHRDADELWRAAQPVAMHGYPIRILSTHNGMTSKFHEFIARVERGDADWSRHRVTVGEAVEQGLLDRAVYGRATTAEERAAWLERLRQDSADEISWRQEYWCDPIDEATAFLTYEQIERAEREGVADGDVRDATGDLFVGVDVGRKRDLTAIWAAERVGETLTTRAVRTLERAPFAEQRSAIRELFAAPTFRRGAIDATGAGMQLAEELVEEFGEGRVEAVTFTARFKEEAAYRVKRAIEERTLLLPRSRDIREDFHSIRRETTTAGNARFEASRSEGRGHGDRFWAAALAVHAAPPPPREPFIKGARGFGNLLQQY